MTAKEARKLDAEVAAEIFGTKVLGEAVCLGMHGDWFVTAAPVADWSPGRRTCVVRPVYQTMPFADLPDFPHEIASGTPVERLFGARLNSLGPVPQYATHAGDAHAVIARMGRWLFEAKWGFTDGVCAGEWQPIHQILSAAGWTVTFGSHTVTAPTFAEAVCRAALAAVRSLNPLPKKE